MPKITHFDVIDSTNTYMKERSESFSNFDIVQVNFQSNGKGRNDRVWESNKGDNLLFSFMIKEKALLEKYKYISLGSAYLVALLLEDLGIKNIEIKWPNDVYVNDKKICGILLTGSVDKFIVVGIGLNVNQIAFPDGLRKNPTSIYLETGKYQDIGDLLGKFAEKLLYFESKSFDIDMLEYVRKHDYLYGKEIEIDGVRGVSNGISNECDILIDGVAYNSGEIVD